MRKRAIKATDTRTRTEPGAFHPFLLSQRSPWIPGDELFKEIVSPSSMAKRAPRGTRVRAKETVRLGGLEVTNQTANSILVKKTTKGVVVTDCCLEEQGM